METVDVNSRDEYGKTPLMDAVDHGNAEAVWAMLDIGAEVNAQNPEGVTALMLAAGNGRKDLVLMLLQAGADTSLTAHGLTAQRVALAEGHTELAQFIEIAGRRPWANKSVDPEKFFFEVMDALRSDQAPRLKHVITADTANMRDETGWSPLHYMVQFGHVHDVQIGEWLISQGADINARDDKGWTPLHYCASADRSEFCKLLLRHGAEPDIQTMKESHSPLSLSITERKNNVARLLIEHGADLDVRIIDEMRPVHMAVVRDNTAMLELLCSNGADLNGQNAIGATALHLATDSWRERPRSCLSNRRVCCARAWPLARKRDIATHFEGKGTKKRLEEMTRLLKTLTAVGRARRSSGIWTIDT